MTDPRETLNRIRKQADAATWGTWATWKDQDSTDWEVLGAHDDYGNPALIASEVEGEDAEFIAAARTDVPRLVDALEKVLELHSPLAGRPFWDAGIRCSGCYESYYDVYEPYPCELVKAITTALEGETR